MPSPGSFQVNASPPQKEPGIECSENGCSFTSALSGMGPVEESVEPEQKGKNSLRRSSGNWEVERRGPEAPAPGEEKMGSKEGC